MAKELPKLAPETEAMIRTMLRSSKKGEEAAKVYEGRIKELRRFKEIIPSVEAGLECGVILDGFQFKAGDILHEIDTVEEQVDVEMVFAEASAREKEFRRQKEQEEADAELAKQSESTAADETSSDTKLQAGVEVTVN